MAGDFNGVSIVVGGWRSKYRQLYACWIVFLCQSFIFSYFAALVRQRISTERRQNKNERRNKPGTHRPVGDPSSSAQEVALAEMQVGDGLGNGVVQEKS